MTRRLALLAATLCFVAAASCSNEEAPPAPATTGGNTTAKQTAPIAKIPILPGYKYYAGGPIMKRDPYGRYRLGDFGGEVQQPPSRGMIFGAKREGDKLEYRVWGNGVLLGVHKGVMRDNVYWEEYGEAYRNGKLIAREKTVNDDANKRSNLTTEDIDPETGEVIRTKEKALSYLPPVLELDPDEDLPDDDDEEEDDAAGAPAKPQAATPPTKTGEANKNAAPAAPADQKALPPAAAPGAH